MNELEANKLLRDNPQFARVLRQFMALYDAADLLDELKPPNGALAAEFCREVAKSTLGRTGCGDEFVQAMVRTRPRFDEIYPQTVDHGAPGHHCDRSCEVLD